jgi:hypothetical protein
MERRIASSFTGRAAVVAVVVLFSCMIPSIVRAQSPTDPGRAQALFDEARELMKDEKFAEACPKLEESQKLDPGGGTILNLGICRMREGRTATAFAILSEALAQAKAADRRDRIATAERLLAELEPTLSRLTVRLPAGAPAPDLVVEVDGVALGSDQLGTAIPFDPGTHEVRASRPGYVAWSARISLAANADALTLDVPPLPANTPEATPIPEQAQRAPAKESAPEPRKQETAKETNWLGYGLAGAGGVAILTGGYFGLRALSLKAKSDQEFDGEHCKTQGCVDDWESAKDAALVSNVCFGVGAAALGAGIYFLVSSPGKDGASRAQAASVSLRATPGGARASASIEF